jgi:hypothetical protein
MANITSKVKLDPLEAAKLGTDAPVNQTKPVAPVAHKPVDDLDDEIDSTPTRRPRFRVTQAKRVSIRGNMCDFKEGRILDSAGYNIEVLKAQGLQLELVKE